MEVNSKKGTVRRVIICDQNEVQSEGSFIEVMAETACILRHVRERVIASKGEEKAEFYMQKLAEIATMPSIVFDAEIERMFKDIRENRFISLAVKFFLRMT